MKKETGAVSGADGSETEQFSQMRPAAPCSFRTFTGSCVGPCDGWLGSSLCWAEDAGSWWGGKLHDEALWNWVNVLVAAQH